MFVSRWRVAEEGYKWVESLPGRWLLTDGRPCTWPRYRSYAPLADTGLFRTFADTPPTPEGILAFANTYGMLGLHEVIPTSGGEWDTPEVERWGEAREDWVKAILTMRHAITLWNLARNRDIPSLARQVFWDECLSAWIDTDSECLAGKTQSDSAYIDCIDMYGNIPGPHTGLRNHLHHEMDALPHLHVRERVTHPGSSGLFPVGDVVGPAFLYVQQVITTHIQWAKTIKPWMAWDGDVDHYPSLCMSVHRLLNALWFQFAEAVTGNKTYRQCEGCHNWFEVAPKIARADKVYCSNTCRTRAHRARHQQELSQQGTSEQGASTLSSGAKSRRLPSPEV